MVKNGNYTLVKRIVGKGLSPGVSFGTAYRLESELPPFYRISIRAEDLETELGRFRQALERSREQYEKDKRKLASALGKEHSYIIDAHLQMLQDPTFLAEIEKRIRDLESPEKALRCVGEELLAAYQSLDDPYFRERSFDFEEVLDRIISNLVEIPSRSEPELPDDLILVATQIGLSTLVQYPLERVRGLVLSKAGRTSHVAIVARSHQIPVVSSVEKVRSAIRTGQNLIVDGSEGVVEIIDSPEGTTALRDRLDLARGKKVQVAGDKEPCATSDGVTVHIYGNTEVASEVDLALNLGAEGVGLFRSEFLYLRDGSGDLGADHDFSVYQTLAQKVGDRPALVRTLDVGIKPDAFPVIQSGEEDAVLGLRGIRFSLQHPELFCSQVRTILRAREFGNVQIVLPMVSSVDEVIEGRRLIREVEAELGRESGQVTSIPVGVLIEVPGAILTIDRIARQVDFLAVGTNDLIQYTLAAGRLNEEISYLYEPLHPAILKSLARVSQAAGNQELPLYVCGEMASNPIQAAVLVGMGFCHLSMTPTAIPAIKKMLRGLAHEDLQQAAQELLEMETLREIGYFVEKRFGEQSEFDKAEAELQLQR